MASSSSNPFRKKSALPEEERFPPLDPIDTSQAYAPPPRTSFPEPQGADDNDSNDDDDIENYDNGERASSKPSTKASKPVKKVRIVSPPPLSPDSPEWPAAQMPDPTYAAYNMPPDPFGGSATDDSDREATPVVATQQPFQPVQAQAPPPPPPPAQRSSGSAPPPNPFSKTLQDIENTRELEIQEREEGEVLKAANASTKPTLDVDAFKRLLMTGTADTGEPATSSTGDAQYTSSEAKQEKMEVAENTQANKEKKVPPPPPPSSRHGKTLKTSGSKPVTETPPPLPKSQPEPTKPVPEPPVGSSETDDSSSEDYSADQAAEAAAAATSPPEQQPPGSAKKPAPAPPPRRGHGRTDTKPTIPNAASLAESSSTLKPTTDDDPPSRSSLDSTPASKSGPAAPAPPPPRRPHAPPKQTGITPSPSVSSTSIPQREPSSHPDAAIVSQPVDSPSKHGKVPAPPPPPARHAPSRRPPSIQGVDSIPRKTSHEGRPRDGSVGSTSGGVPPPPPPPRMRGASPNNKTQGEAAEAAEAEAAVQPPGIGADILADLDALRREVDALRGRVD